MFYVYKSYYINGHFSVKLRNIIVIASRYYYLIGNYRPCA